MGEQSNAHRILLRYDRKSRHRRIKKQRRYERLAATSQFRDTNNHDLIAQSFLNLCRPVDDRTLSGGRSPYLRCIQECTHTLASVEPLSYNQKGWGAKSAADHLYSSDFYQSILRIMPGGVTIQVWYQRPLETSPHPGVLPVSLISTDI